VDITYAIVNIGYVVQCPLFKGASK